MSTGDTLQTDPDDIADCERRAWCRSRWRRPEAPRSCKRRGIPWSVFRAISDRPSDKIDEETFRLSNRSGTPNAKAVAAYYAKHPGRIPKMAKVAKGAKLEDHGRRRHQSRHGHLTPSAPARSLERMQQ